MAAECMLGSGLGILSQTSSERCTRMRDADWDIRSNGRAWASGEAMQRYELTPEKLEMIAGKLLWSEEDRVNLLGLLLENVGADRAVRLGNAQVWRDAVARLAS